MKLILIRLQYNSLFKSSLSDVQRNSFWDINDAKLYPSEESDGRIGDTTIPCYGNVCKTKVLVYVLKSVASISYNSYILSFDSLENMKHLQQPPYLGIEFYLFVSHGGMKGRGSTRKFRNARVNFIIEPGIICHLHVYFYKKVILRSGYSQG